MGQSNIPSKDLEEDIDRYIRMGYRIDMIMPADAPHEVLLSKGGESVRLRSKNRQHSSNADHVTGRAGMMYRDLIPGRAGGRIVASHIRLAEDGPIPDCIHYHKIQFQMIYCLRGRIRVVYEDQGPPFWLEPGDCVLQPPEIRHRVLESIGQAEVIEIAMPAEHETWIDHELKLPSSELRSDRDFSGQRFVRHVAAEAEWENDEILELQSRDTGISAATNRMFFVYVTKAEQVGIPYTAGENHNMISIFLKLNDKEVLSIAIMKKLNAPKHKGWLRKLQDRLV